MCEVLSPLRSERGAALGLVEGEYATTFSKHHVDDDDRYVRMPKRCVLDAPFVRLATAFLCRAVCTTASAVSIAASGTVAFKSATSA